MTSGRSRIGLLWRGDRQVDAHLTPGAERLGPLMAALRRLGVDVQAVVYEDEAIDSVRAELAGLDGLLVWVNPIQDGANRALLDGLLRQVSAQGVWVSAHPDVVLKLGTKEVLYRTRDVGWGAGTDLYPNMADFLDRFPRALASGTPRVLKQGRGNGGNGVWKVTLVGPRWTSGGPPGPGALVEVQHAFERGDVAPQRAHLGDFLARCEQYFAWSGCLVDQPFQERLGDGMVRCYFVHDEIVGFCHQWPKALLAPSSPSMSHPAGTSPFEDAGDPRYRPLKDLVEHDWVPKMKAVLGLGTSSLPVIWDADFLFGPKGPTGQDTYVLCEINVSAVWPFPGQAVEKLARASVLCAARVSRPE